MDALILVTEIAEKLILFVLTGLSVWSVAIMFDRRKSLSVESKVDVAHLRTLIESKNRSAVLAAVEHKQGYLAGALRALVSGSQNPKAAEKVLASYTKMEKIQLERGLGVLATLGANAPFVGLLGTVLGIIRSFAFLGSQSGSAAVMSGVSQALYATAFGLFVAIPAVVAYNVFSRKIRQLTLTVESLRDLYVSGFF